MPPKAIKYDAVVGPGATPFYGTIILSHICYDDNSAVNIKHFLSLLFLSPAAIKYTDFNVSTQPWVEVNAEVANEHIDDTRTSIKAKLNAKAPVSWDGATINIDVNGDLTQNPDLYLKSFMFGADTVPDVDGSISVNCAPSPDPALASLQQAVTFAMGTRVVQTHVPLGKTTVYKVPAGTYTVKVVQLATQAQTVVADTEASPKSVTVAPGAKVDVKVTYGKVAKYSAFDVIIGKISPLENEKYQVCVTDAGKTLAKFSSPPNHTTALRKLPASGTAEVSVEGRTLNNVEYSFDTKSEHLAPALFPVRFLQDDLKSHPIDTKGFVKLRVKVTTDVSLGSNVSVHLTASPLVYTQTVKAAAGTTDFKAPVAPGQYTVQAINIIEKGIVYVVSTVPKLTVAKDGSTVLELTLRRGANLSVKGFPNFLSFGGLWELVPSNQADLVAARVSSVFKYAGISGSGDPDVFLDDDPSTVRTIELARRVKTQLADDNPVLPVMVSYTCNMSGGSPKEQLQNVDLLTHGFANLIASLNKANAKIDQDHPVPASYVINPDFLGACQQDKLSPEFVMKVREPLSAALAHWNLSKTIPDTITDCLRGYVLAVNWLFRTIAPACSFGWQVNLWGVGSGAWVFKDDEPAQVARQTGDFATSMGVFDKDNLPDFLAVDRYEADDFTIRGYGGSWCYGPREWGRFFDFCAALSAQLRFPIMPWQIPASWTPLTTDVVNDDFDSQHWGTGGTYMLGDAGLNSDYHNVNPKILALEFSPALPYMGKTATDTFVRAEPFDLTDPKYLDFPRRGIFAVLLGGGSTTGIVSSIGNPGSFVRDRLHNYMKSPIHFDEKQKR